MCPTGGCHVLSPSFTLFITFLYKLSLSLSLSYTPANRQTQSLVFGLTVTQPNTSSFFFFSLVPRSQLVTRGLPVCPFVVFVLTLKISSRYRVLCPPLLLQERKEQVLPRPSAEMILDYVKLEPNQYRYGQNKVFVCLPTLSSAALCTHAGVTCIISLFAQNSSYWMLLSYYAHIPRAFTPPVSCLLTQLVSKVASFFSKP